jgi:hypothetical protein
MSDDTKVPGGLKAVWRAEDEPVPVGANAEHYLSLAAGAEQTREAFLQLLVAFEDELLGEWHGTSGFNGRMVAADAARAALGLPAFVTCQGPGCDCDRLYGSARG